MADWKLNLKTRSELQPSPCAGCTVQPRTTESTKTTTTTFLWIMMLEPDGANLPQFGITVMSLLECFLLFLYRKLFSYMLPIMAPISSQWRRTSSNIWTLLGQTFPYLCQQKIRLFSFTLLVLPLYSDNAIRLEKPSQKIWIYKRQKKEERREERNKERGDERKVFWIFLLWNGGLVPSGDQLRQKPMTVATSATPCRTREFTGFFLEPLAAVSMRLSVARSILHCKLIV